MVTDKYQVFWKASGGMDLGTQGYYHVVLLDCLSLSIDSIVSYRKAKVTSRKKVGSILMHTSH